MESLQDWGLLGEIYIGCGFIRGKLAGIYYDILGWVCDRLAAGVALCKALGARLPGGGQFVIAFGVAESPQGDGRYGSPPGRSFCAYKRNQNTLGAVPQDPLAAKLRLDTDWTFQR